ncbi:MAG: TonB-dependent receptor [Polyangiales bacterium]
MQPAPAPAPVEPAPAEPPPAEPSPAEPLQTYPAPETVPVEGPSPEASPSEPVGDPPTEPGVAGTPAAEVAPEGEYDKELDVIVVTVDRREKDLQDYAGSATALSQDSLQQQNVNSVRVLSQATPYVQIGTQEGNTEIFIRGVGSDYNTELGDPAVATHIDGIYIPRPRGVGSMFFDLERVEINRGPQGTLRGRNATAGTLNIVTAKPQLGEWDASASLQLGNYWQKLTRGMVNIPIGETLALRMATFSENRDPFYDNAGPIHTIKAAESADVFGYRASAKWEPTKRLTVIAQHDYTHEGGTGFLGTNFTPAYEAGLRAKDVKHPRDVVYRGGQPSQLLKHYGVNAEATLDLGPVLIGYNGAFRSLDYKQNQGSNAGVFVRGFDYSADPTTLDNWTSTYWHSRSKSVVQELRIFAPDKARVRWSAGGFFFNEEQAVFLGNTADQSDSGFLGVEFNMNKVSGRSWAGFVDATADIIDSLRATAGVRVTNETKSRRGIGHIYQFSGPGASVRQRFGTEGFRYRGLGRNDYAVGGGGASDDFSAGVRRFGERDTIEGAISRGDLVLGDNINEQRGKYEDTFVDFRLGLDLDVTDSNLLYVMFGTGHKSGGFNDNIKTSTGSIALEYSPEVLYSTEIGSKNGFFDNHLIANLSGFWYEYKDQQFQSVQQVADTGVAGSVAASAVRWNAANSRIFGLEADVTAHLPWGFTGTLAGLLLDARFAGGDPIIDPRVAGEEGAPPNQVDLKGNRLPRAPVASLNYSLSWAHDTTVGRFDWLVAAQTKSKQSMTPFNGNQGYADRNMDQSLNDQVERYTRLDASAGYTRPDKRTRLEVFGSNLTDIAFMTTLNSSPGLQRRFFNPPRQFGVRLTVQL